MSKGRKRLWIILGAVFGVLILSIAGIAIGGVEINEEFGPEEEFLLDAWVPIEIAGIDFSINKAVFMLFLAGTLTSGSLIYFSRKLQDKPNRTQAAFEMLYGLVEQTIVGDNIEKRRVAQRWFPFVLTLFVFVFLNNLLGFLPLPIDTHNPVTIAGVEVPQLAIYAATSNLSIPLALAAVVWVSYNFEGVRHHGPVGYMRGLVPAGVPGALKPLFFGIELLSHFSRLISLSVRLFANMLAGHMLILIMGAGMVILLGNVFIFPLTMPLAVAFYCFEVLLVCGLQAFIFSALTSIYIGGAVAEEH